MVIGCLISLRQTFSGFSGWLETELPRPLAYCKTRRRRGWCPESPTDPSAAYSNGGRCEPQCPGDRARCRSHWGECRPSQSIGAPPYVGCRPLRVYLVLPDSARGPVPAVFAHVL